MRSSSDTILPGRRLTNAWMLSLQPAVTTPRWLLFRTEPTSPSPQSPDFGRKNKSTKLIFLSTSTRPTLNANSAENSELRLPSAQLGREKTLIKAISRTLKHRGHVNFNRH